MSVNNFIPIKKNSGDKVSTNFNQKELRCRSVDAPETFLLDYDLVLAAEFLRDFTDSAIIPVSTYRTPAHKSVLVKSLGAANDSLHTTKIGAVPASRALDLKFASNNEVNILLVRKAFEEKNHVYQQLRQIGINGIGFYDTFLHLDTRVTAGLQPDHVYGGFAMWNEQNYLKKKKLQAIANILPDKKPYSLGLVLI